ncbi:hypothetical protein WER97_11520 [Staphylococcus felis]|uniref:hypothetical protein n=1 Tax=Staphylococcus felis TaxID=46127 RepID=UPI003967671F
MKIKVNKEFKLLELIEYIKKNEIADKVFFDNKGKGEMVVGDNRYLYMSDLNLTDTFFIEVEEEITEETVIPRLVAIYDASGQRNIIQLKQKSISDIVIDYAVAFYMLNDDMTMTLIWKDGELIK